jgi:hypothetical protein
MALDEDNIQPAMVEKGYREPIVKVPLRLNMSNRGKKQ